MNDNTADVSAPPNGRITRRRWAIALWIAQVLATVVAVAACAAEVESILFSGPALACIGWLLALVVRPLHAWSVSLYGLSSPVVVAICAALIALCRWGPNEAEGPILAIYFIYAFLSIPAALAVFPIILQWRTSAAKWWRFPGQYSLRGLLLFTTALCITVPILRFLFVSVRHNDTVIFSLFALATLTLVGFSLYIFVASRRCR
jgi:hypothetical protein